MSRVIALLTDFGTADIYVGVMKAVMQKITPNAKFIDISHAIPPQAVRVGAFALKNSYAYFPVGTVFLVVVDPEVGSKRRPILVKAGDYYFIAPDNGVLSYALAELGQYEAVELSNPDYRLTTLSHTFHGRDVFAPAAAYAARGDIELIKFGTRLETIVQLPLPLLAVSPEAIQGEVVHIDHFGNIITSISKFQWLDETHLQFSHADQQFSINAAQTHVFINGRTLEGIKPAYHHVTRGSLLVQIDSAGALEIAVNHGNAAQALGVVIGDKVNYTPPERWRLCEGD